MLILALALTLLAACGAEDRFTGEFVVEDFTTSPAAREADSPTGGKRLRECHVGEEVRNIEVPPRGFGSDYNADFADGSFDHYYISTSEDGKVRLDGEPICRLPPTST